MEKINGRTLEEIKAGLTFCTTGNVPGYGCNASCPYLNTENCWLPVKCDALALIQRLEAERDAAIQDLKAISHCCTCSNRDPGEDGVCKNSGGGGAPFTHCPGYVWDKKLPEPPEEDAHA